MSESNLINRGTLLGFILGVMLGTGVSTGVWVFLRSRGQDQANREQPPVEPPAKTEADKRQLERLDRDQKIRKLEQLAESVRLEIDASEKQIELLERSQKLEGDDPAKRHASLQQRLVECEKDLGRIQGEVTKAEAERMRLLQEIEQPGIPDPATVAQVVAKNPSVATAKAALDAKKVEITKSIDAGTKDGDPRMVKLKIEQEKLQAALDTAMKLAEFDAVKVAQAIEAAQRKSRVGQLDFTIKVKGEERDARKVECDALKKLVDSDKGNSGARLNIQAMRDGLKPQREMLDKVNAELVKLRIEAKINE